MNRRGRFGFTAPASVGAAKYSSTQDLSPSISPRLISSQNFEKKVLENQEKFKFTAIKTLGTTSIKTRRTAAPVGVSPRFHLLKVSFYESATSR